MSETQKEPAKPTGRVHPSAESLVKDQNDRHARALQIAEALLEEWHVGAVTANSGTQWEDATTEEIAAVIEPRL